MRSPYGAHRPVIRRVALWHALSSQLLPCHDVYKNFSLPPSLPLSHSQVASILKQVKVTARPSDRQHKVVSITRESSRELV